MSLKETDRDGQLIERPPSDAADRMAAATSRLVGKAAVCVASTIGIGFAVARRLAQEGARVLVCSRTQAQVDAAVAALRAEHLDAHGLVCDVDSAEQRAALVARCRELMPAGVDGLFLNQATAASRLLMETSEEDWRRVFRVNVESRWVQVREFRAAGLLRRGSSVVITNGAGSFAPNPGNAAFYLSETTLLGLTVLLARELGREGIRVNGVAPGPVRTKLASGLWKNGAEERIARGQPPRDGDTMGYFPHAGIWLGRIGEPDDFGGIVAFLVSEDSRLMTGQTLTVDGGAYTRL